MPCQHLPQPGTYIPVQYGLDVVAVLVVAIAKNPDTGRMRICISDTAPKWIPADSLGMGSITPTGTNMP
jgi:hypothetical protein